jgi:hypothetical protein
MLDAVKNHMIKKHLTKSYFYFSREIHFELSNLKSHKEIKLKY